MFAIPKHLKPQKMKAKVNILTFLLTFSFGWLYAGGDSAPAPYLPASELTPSVPMEATFEDSPPENPSLLRWLERALSPSTPKEADFDETPAVDVNIDIVTILPTVPLEADFNDSL
jgi:hypothetical protein